MFFQLILNLEKAGSGMEPASLRENTPPPALSERAGGLSPTVTPFVATRLPVTRNRRGEYGASWSTGRGVAGQRPAEGVAEDRVAG
jgi:hypothetical protein